MGNPAPGQKKTGDPLCTGRQETLHIEERYAVRIALSGGLRTGGFIFIVMTKLAGGTT